MGWPPEKHKALRERLKLKGVCTRCHKRKAERQGGVCSECNAQVKARHTRLNKEGRCRDCGCTLDNPALIRCINCAGVVVQANFWRRQRI